MRELRLKWRLGCQPVHLGDDDKILNKVCLCVLCIVFVFLFIIRLKHQINPDHITLDHINPWASVEKY